MSKIEYKDILAFHPGYYLKQLIEDQHISQEELAKRLQASPKYISDLVNGRINFTEETILKLATAFGTSTSMWLNLNQSFIEKKLEIEQQKKLERECELVRQLDYQFWVKLGILPAARFAKDKAMRLQSYFKISSLSVLYEKNFLVQYRTGISERSQKNMMNANAWVQTAINLGSTMEVEPFSLKKLNLLLPEIRAMNTEDPQVFLPKLKDLLRTCGIAFVLLPNLKSSGINGAVKWWTKDKVILAMNDRRKYADTFWFSLFHELGHVRQQRIKLLHVSTEKPWIEKETLLEKLEKEADKFAQDYLIPSDAYDQFLKKTGQKFDEKNIRDFAKEIGVLPGIVLGRLQHDKLIKHNSPLNELRDQYSVKVDALI